MAVAENFYPKQNGNFMLQILDPKNGFQMKQCKYPPGGFKDSKVQNRTETFRGTRAYRNTSVVVRVIGQTSFVQSNE